MSSHDGSLYLPEAPKTLTQQSIWRWFQNITVEAQRLDLGDAQRHVFQEYYRAAGLLRPWRRPFFRHHYTYPLLLAAREIFAREPRPRVLDLGCGTGTQSLLFALLGAEVVSVDMDADALEVLRKRKALYEAQCGRTLSITIECGNVFELDFERLGPFDAVYSLFAFNMMQPSSALLKRLAPHLQADAVFAVQDGNREHFFNRVFRSRFASAKVLRPELQEAGFTDIRHVGCYAIPPIFWFIASAKLLEPLDRRLCQSQWLAVSYLHLARRSRA